MNRKSKILKEQALIVKGILDKEEEAWAGENLQSSSALFKYKLAQITKKQLTMKEQLNKIKKEMGNLIGVIVDCQDRPAVAAIKENLELHSPQRLEGSRDMAQLIEDAIAASTQKRASSEDKFIHIGNGKYYPPLVFELIHVGILRLHDSDPTRVTLNYQLGRI